VIAQYHELKTIGLVKNMGKNTISELKYPSKPSKSNKSLSNGPKYNNKSHMCGLKRGRGDMPLKICSNLTSSGENMSQNGLNTSNNPPTNSPRLRNGPSVKITTSS